MIVSGFAPPTITGACGSPISTLLRMLTAYPTAQATWMGKVSISASTRADDPPIRRHAIFVWTFGKGSFMARMPSDQHAFAEEVSSILSRLRPALSIEHAGPREIVVNGRRLDLENLVRLVTTDEERGVEIVEQYLEHLFDEESFAVASMPWAVARPKIMPRIQPVGIFNHLSQDMVAYVPFVNDTVIVFVVDLPNMTVSVTTEQLLRWGVDAEELEPIARANLERMSADLDFRTLESEEGGRAIVISMQDGYDASRLLLEDLYETFAYELDGDFMVAIPSRDMFLALSPEPSTFVSRVQARVREDYNRLPYPISDRLFYCCMDGIAGTEPIRNAA